MSRAVAVLITLYHRDDLALFDLALLSVEGQLTDREIRVYLWCDGPLTCAQEAWLAANAGRFHRIGRSTRSLGLGAVLNRLIGLLGDEEFVFRMDGDDISLPQRFARQIALLESDPSLSLVGCQAEDICDAGRVLGPRRYPVTWPEVRAALHKATPLLHPAFCFRRKIFEDPRLRYPEAYLCEDLALLVTLHGLGHRMANHAECLLRWRTGASFFRRRSDARRGLAEMTWYFRALRVDRGPLTPALVFPLLRLGLRLLPPGAARLLYRSRLRRAVLGT